MVDQHLLSVWSQDSCFQASVHQLLERDDRCEEEQRTSQDTPSTISVWHHHESLPRDHWQWSQEMRDGCWQTWSDSVSLKFERKKWNWKSRRKLLLTKWKFLRSMVNQCVKPVSLVVKITGTSQVSEHSFFVKSPISLGNLYQTNLHDLSGREIWDNVFGNVFNNPHLWKIWSHSTFEAL